MQQVHPVFEKYFSKEAADYYAALFTRAGLACTVEAPKDFFDVATGSNNADMTYCLRMPANAFDQAQNIIEQEVRKAGIDEDYYLRSYTNDELHNVLFTPDEWSRQDVAAAKVLLEERNVTLDAAHVNKVKTAIREKEKEKRTISLPVLIFIYLFGPLGIVAPMVAGLFIYFLQETDRDGNKSYAFSDKYRTHGIIIAVVGTIVSLLGLKYLL
jgi:hypothetical protein